MILNESKFVRLYGISSEPDETGYFQLEPLKAEGFNKEVDNGTLDEELDHLKDYLFGSGKCYGVTDEMFRDVDNVVYKRREMICFSCDDGDDLKVPDITGKIHCSPGAKIFLVVNGELSAYHWVVSEPRK